MLLPSFARRFAVQRTAPRLAAIAHDDGHREKIVLIGCGWAGYRFLSEIDANKYRVQVVSPRNHFLFTPLLASAAVGGSTLESICTPIRPLAAEKHAKFYEAKARWLEKDTKSVICETLDGRRFPLHYDRVGGNSRVYFR
jgi:NADH:ubiquinone reductase (non-electrogenic)